MVPRNIHKYLYRSNTYRVDRISRFHPMANPVYFPLCARCVSTPNEKKGSLSKW